MLLLEDEGIALSVRWLSKPDTITIRKPAFYIATEPIIYKLINLPFMLLPRPVTFIYLLIPNQLQSYGMILVQMCILPKDIEKMDKGIFPFPIPEMKTLGGPTISISFRTET